jgi:hypothetical protein
MRTIPLSAMLMMALLLTMTAVSAPAQQALRFTPVNPCRVVDTRNPNGPFGGPAIQGGTSRNFSLPEGSCDLPLGAAAYSLNVTVVPAGRLGFLTIWPTGQQQPVVSTMNSDGRVKANAAIVLSGSNGAAVSVYASDTTNVILDVNGYFTPVNDSNLTFYPLTPCRVVDTRGPNGALGGPYLQPATERDFPVLEASSCGIPASAQAYSLNVTAVPLGTLQYLTVWPAGRPQPVVSTLNAPTGTVVANAAVIKPGDGGDVAVYPTDATNLIIDINGYWAPAGTNGLSLYGVTPCRVLDTRQGNGSFNGELTVNVEGSSCSVPGTAAAYVLNGTVVPPASFGYLTLWADGQPQPNVSTLNAYDGAVSSNMAIVQTTNGSIDAYASDSTNLILDVSSYFAP